MLLVMSVHGARSHSLGDPWWLQHSPATASGDGRAKTHLMWEERMERMLFAALVPRFQLRVHALLYSPLLHGKGTSSWKTSHNLKGS